VLTLVKETVLKVLKSTGSQATQILNSGRHDVPEFNNAFSKNEISRANRAVLI